MEICVSVQRAAAYMDYFYPGWFYQVDPDALDLSSCMNCVLGQAIGGRSATFDWTGAKNAILGSERDCGSDRDYRPEMSPVGFSIGVFSSNEFYLNDWKSAVRQRHALAGVEAAQAIGEPVNKRGRSQRPTVGNADTARHGVVFCFRAGHQSEGDVMIDIGPNLTHIIFGIGHFLKFLIEVAACLVVGLVLLIAMAG